MYTYIQDKWVRMGYCKSMLSYLPLNVLFVSSPSNVTLPLTHIAFFSVYNKIKGLHYTSEGMGLPTHRAGALLKFMSRGKQEWKRL